MSAPSSPFNSFPFPFNAGLSHKYAPFSSYKFFFVIRVPFVLFFSGSPVSGLSPVANSEDFHCNREEQPWIKETPRVTKVKIRKNLDFQEMFEGYGYYDPNPIPSLLDGFQQEAAASINMEGGEHHLGFDLEQEKHSQMTDNNTIWDLSTHQNINRLANFTGTQQYDNYTGLTQQNSQFYDTTYNMTSPVGPDILNLMHLPVAPPVNIPSLQQTPLLHMDVSRNINCYPVDMLVNNDLPTVDDGGQMLHMDYQHRSHLIRDLFQSLPQTFDGSLFQEEASYDQSPLFGFRRQVKVEGGAIIATEKQRRVQMNERYNVLKSLIPNLAKADRASIVLGGIHYIQELQRTVNELKLLIEKKKCGMNYKIQKTENIDPTVVSPPTTDMESTTMRQTRNNNNKNSDGVLFSDTLRSSWLVRKSKEVTVDVRIVDDEVNMKVIQKKKKNSLLIASIAIHELKLDVVHVSAGVIGENYIFLFNTKIIQGSLVYANAIANKLLDAIERPYTPFSYTPSGY